MKKLLTLAMLLSVAIFTVGCTKAVEEKPAVDPAPEVDPGDPAEPATDPAEPATDPVEPATDPVEPATDPVEPAEPADPAADLDIDDPTTTVEKEG